VQDAHVHMPERLGFPDQSGPGTGCLPAAQPIQQGIPLLRAIRRERRAVHGADRPTSSRVSPGSSSVDELLMGFGDRKTICTFRKGQQPVLAVVVPIVVIQLPRKKPLGRSSRRIWPAAPGKAIWMEIGQGPGRMSVSVERVVCAALAESNASGSSGVPGSGHGGWRLTGWPD
jgi:hypothetical protein